MSQTLKPTSDISFNLFINELSLLTPLWSSIDEGLTSPTDSDFIQIDPIVATFGNNIISGGFLNSKTSKPTFNKFRLSSIQAKIRIDTGGIDVSVNMILFDKDFVHALGNTRLIINTTGFQDFVVDMTVNLTDIDDWVLDEAIIHISAGNVTTSTVASQLVDTKISVFEIEVITFNDCIIERLPQSDGEFFTPTTWENELNVNHLLWESVATSGDAEFVKALDTSAIGDILFEFQGVGRIPESGTFRLRARNNGVDDSALARISLYDNLTHSIVASGDFGDTQLNGNYNTYEVSLVFLPDFLPSSLYTVDTEITSSGVLGISDTEISTQRLTLFMPNGYCCLSPGIQNSTVQSPLVEVTTTNIEIHNKDLFITLPGDVNDNFFEFINDDFENPAVADLDTITYRDNLFIPDPIITDLFLRTSMVDPITPDYHHYVEFEPLIGRPDSLTVKIRIRSKRNFNFSGDININLILTDGFITGNINDPSNPNHIVELVGGFSSNVPIRKPEMTSLINKFDLDLRVLSDDQYDSFNKHPKIGIVAYDEIQFINQFNILETQFSLIDMEISVVEIEYILSENIETCTQFLYPISDTVVLTDGIWEDNRPGIFINKWATVDQGVATFNDDDHITYPTQIGQTPFPSIGFGVDQITLDPTSMKLNFRGGGIEPSGSVAHTMTFAALYDTNGITVATNGSTPIASLSGDLRSYTIDMTLATANRELWDLSRPQLELKFFVSNDAELDVRFSEVEIEVCGVCPRGDTSNVTLVLENLGDCDPESIMRPNADIDILPFGEWSLCGEVVDSCLNTIKQFAGLGVEKCPGIIPSFIPDELSTEELRWVDANNIVGAEGAVAVTGRVFTVTQENLGQLEVVSSCTLIARGFNFKNLLPPNVDQITGLKVLMKRRGIVQDSLAPEFASSALILVEQSVFLLDASTVPISKNKANQFNEPSNEVVVNTPSSSNPNKVFTHWPDLTNSDEGIVTYGNICGTQSDNDDYWGSEDGVTVALVKDDGFSVGLEVVSAQSSSVFTTSQVILGSIAVHVDYFQVQLSYTTLGGGGGTVEAQAWPCVDQRVEDVTDLTSIKLRELSLNRPTTIYWSEKGFGAASVFDTPQTQDMTIKKSNMNGDNVVTILDSSSVESPDHLVVDWVHDYLYFTESGNTVLQRCNLDGSNLTPIADLTDLVIEDTFIDFDEKRLYFTSSLSGGSGTIEYLNLPSGGIPQNWATGFNHPTGLCKYQDVMFVADAEDGAVYRTTGGASKTLVLGDLGNPSGLVGDYCAGTLFVSNFDSAGGSGIIKFSIVNPVPIRLPAIGVGVHDMAINARNGLLYYTTWGGIDPFVPDKGNLRRMQTDGDGDVALQQTLDLPMKVSIDTTDVETHTSTLRFGLTDLSRCCLGPTSGYVSIKGAELSQPTSNINSFAYIKAKIINSDGDTLWQARNEPGKIADSNSAIQIATIGFHNQATNPDFANRAQWADAILELNIEQFLQPIQPTGFGCPELDSAFDLYAAQFHVTACSGIENNDNINLFIDGSGDLSNVITLYTRSGFLDNDSLNPVSLVIINDAKPANANINLFTEGFGEQANSGLDLIVSTRLDFSGGGNDDPFTLFTTSTIVESGFMNLVLLGGGFGVETSTMNLFIPLETTDFNDNTTLFVDTLSSHDDTMDLFVRSSIENSGFLNLVLTGIVGPPLVNTTTLMLEQNDITPIAKMDMFITAPATFTDTMKLFTKAVITHSDEMNLFTGASDGFETVDLFLENKEITEGMNLVIIAPDGSFDNDNIKLMVHGATISGQFSATQLFTKVDIKFNDNMNLFVAGPAFSEITSNMNLVLIGKQTARSATLFIEDTTQSIVDNKTLFIGGPLFSSESGSMNLFMARDIDSIARFGPTLFLKTTTPISGELTMFIEGGQDTTNNVELFTHAPTPINDDQKLYIHGF